MIAPQLMPPIVLDGLDASRIVEAAGYGAGQAFGVWLAVQCVGLFAVLSVGLGWGVGRWIGGPVE